MDRHVSLNLDLIRWVAALLVFACHFVQLGTSNIPASVPEPLGRLGVVLFFVLSGYVIDFVAHCRHADFRGYMDARLARLLSVFLPALLLTFVADSIGRAIQPSLYQNYPEPLSVRTASSLPAFATFLFENSLFSLRWLSNGPMWSIAYEFWYYVLFGVAFYLTGVLRVVLLCVAILLAGYKILLLAPIWLLGVAIHRCGGRWAGVNSTYRAAGLLFAVTALMLACTPLGFETLAPLREAGRFLPNGYHTYFLSDYVLALPVCLVVALMTSVGRRAAFGRLEAIIRIGAGTSFSLYLFHVPSILLSRSLGWYDPSVPWQWLPAAAVALAACHGLASVTEARKARWLVWIAAATGPFWRRRLRKMTNGYERV